MIFENSGCFFAGKGSNPINIQYFFITDWIKKKHIKVQYYPTKEMVADFTTKLLQGHLFYKFRDAVLGIYPSKFEEYRQTHQETLSKYNLSENVTAPHSSHKLQERVGSNAERTRDGRINDMPTRKEEAKSMLGIISLAAVNSNQKVTTKKKKV